MSVYLITGTNRGIGLQLAKNAVEDTGTEKVYVSVRDASKVSGELAALVKAAGSKVEVVEIESADFESPKKAAKVIEQKSGRLDVVIANAGLLVEGTNVPLREIDVASFVEHTSVNVAGVIALFQATAGLLDKGKSPQFVAVSSGAGILAQDRNFNSGSYGASKAQLNWTVAKIAQEEQAQGKNIVAYTVHPGVVATDMFVLANPPKELQPITTEQSATGILGLVNTDKPKAGLFWNYDGTPLPYSAK